VDDRGERARQGAGADALGGRVGGDQLGVRVLDAAQLAQQRVEVGVADLRRVVGVVALVVVGDQAAQLGGALGVDGHRRRLAVAAIAPPRATRPPITHRYSPAPTLKSRPNAFARSWASLTSPRSARAKITVRAATTIAPMAMPSTLRSARRSTASTTRISPNVRKNGPSRTSSDPELLNPVNEMPAMVNQVTNEPIATSAPPTSNTMAWTMTTGRGR